MSRGAGSPATTSPRRVLVVEDEGDLARVVKRHVEDIGCQVRIAPTGETALEAAATQEFDLVLLDVMLPGIDGLEVCRQVRTFSDCYVLMLTARTDEVDTLVGLSAGADDYMTKPFSPRELVARVHVLLRRPRTGGGTATTHRASAGEEAVDPPPRTFGALVIDVPAREVLVDGSAVALTRTEFDILAALSGHPKRVFTRSALIGEVWGEDWVGDDHLVDVHIGHLRRKLGDDAANPRYVRTVRGVGYRMGAG